MVTATNTTPRLRTVKQFAQEQDLFSEDSLRWLIFHQEQNGLSTALCHVGRRIFIDQERFWAWVTTQQRRETR
jgi:hypothetical protein